MKPFSQACENNRRPILGVLTEAFTQPGLILEIGSGTGQHAAYFAARLPHIRWQPSDRAESLSGIQLWVDDANLSNLEAPIEFDVNMDPWPIEKADGVFSANTAHILSWPEVEKMFAGVARILTPGGAFCLYGPFHYGEPISESNARFDAFIRERDPASGVRDFAEVNRLALANGLTFWRDITMPANNHTLIWRK